MSTNKAVISRRHFLSTVGTGATALATARNLVFAASPAKPTISHRERIENALVLEESDWLPIGTDAPRAFQVSEDAQFVRIETPDLAAAICKKGYVSGVASRSFLDKKTGFHDPGFGLDIVDWIMEPGSD